MGDRADLEKFFREADADGSGSLTVSELAGTLRKYGYKGTDEEIKEFFLSADTSGDMLVSLEEYMTAMEAAPPHVHLAAQLRRIFSQLDEDGNGEITPTEFRSAMSAMTSPLTDDDINDIISKLDKDGSNSISAEEFVAEFIAFLTTAK